MRVCGGVLFFFFQLLVFFLLQCLSSLLLSLLGWLVLFKTPPVRLIKAWFAARECVALLVLAALRLFLSSEVAVFTWETESLLQPLLHFLLLSFRVHFPYVRVLWSFWGHEKRAQLFPRLLKLFRAAPGNKSLPYFLSFSALLPIYQFFLVSLTSRAPAGLLSFSLSADAQQVFQDVAPAPKAAFIRVML